MAWVSTGAALQTTSSIPILSVEFEVLLKQFLSLVEDLLFNDAQMGKVPRPLLTVLFRAGLLADFPRLGISHILVLAPRPNSNVLGARQETGDEPVVLRRGRGDLMLIGVAG